MPNFKVIGKLESTVCQITEPLSGELQVVFCDALIRSIELQLVRVETCGCAEGFAEEGIDLMTNCKIDLFPHSFFVSLICS